MKKVMLALLFNFSFCQAQTTEKVLVLGKYLYNTFAAERTDSSSINIDTTALFFHIIHDTVFVFSTKVIYDTTYIITPIKVFQQQPDQQATKGQTKFTFLNVPVNDADWMIYKNGIPKSSTKLNVAGQRGYTFKGNDIYISDAVVGDIIHYVQLR
jgi:hypothetical protein